MATIIDALAISLGLDATGFKKGQKDIEEGLKKSEEKSTKAAKEMESGGKKAATAYSKVRKEVLALTGAIIGLIAVKSFVEKVTAGDAEIGRFAKNVGASTEEVSTWVNAANKAGGTAEGMAGSIQNLNDQMVGLHSLMKPVSGEVITGLSLSGVDTNKYFDRATTITDKFLMLADAFKGMDASKAQGLGKMIGLDVGTVNMLMLGRDSVGKILEQQRRLNIVTEADAKAAQRRQVAWRNLMDTFERIGRVILNQLSPVFLKMFNDFSKWLGKKENLDKIVNAFTKLGNALDNLDWDAVGEGFSKVLTVAMALVTALADIVDGIRSISTFNTWQHGGDDSWMYEDKAEKKPAMTQKEKLALAQQRQSEIAKTIKLGQLLGQGALFTQNKTSNSNSSTTHINNLHVHAKDASPNNVAKATRGDWNSAFNAQQAYQ